MKTRLLCLLLTLIPITLLGQKEMANWYFGFNAGLDFNTGNPVPQNDSNINTIEASSVMSDSEGNLLFYTDGEAIYNRNFDLMSNGAGINGHVSSTTGAIVLEYPFNNNLYYVFTSDAVQLYENSDDNTGSGLNYSIVDMSLSGGLGQVIEKNINLLTESSEKLTAVAREDDLGFWVLTHHQDIFYAYSITNTGISQPVLSQLGPNISNFNNIRGWLKFSPDGKKVAIAHSRFEPSFGGSFYLYDFNQNTGQLSNQRILGDEFVYYGVEFSANSERLYVSAKEVLNGGAITGNINLYQYDLLSPDIQASSYLLGSIESDAFSDIAGALQLAIDCKIYYSNTGDRLSVITRPNRYNEESDLRLERVGLGDSSSSLGLPGCVQSFFDNIIEYDSLCFGEPVQFNLNTNRGISSVTWVFDDPVSMSNTSTLINPTHQFTSPGVYIVSAAVQFENGTNQFYEKIVNIVDITGVEDIELRQCDVDGIDDGLSIFNLEESIDIFFPSGNINFLEYSFYQTLQDASNLLNPIDNFTSFYNTTNNQIVYARIDASLDCSIIVSITLIVQQNSMPFEREREICEIINSQEEVAFVLSDILAELNEDYGNAQIEFYTSLEDAIVEINDITSNPISTFSELLGIYYRVENDEGCQAIGFYKIITNEIPDVEDVTLPLCDPQAGLVLSFNEDYQMYQWENGSITSTITVFETGTYEVFVYNAAGCSDVATFTVIDAPQFDVEIVVNDFQQSNSINVSVTTQVDEVSYSLDNGASFQESPNFNNLVPGTYYLVVKDDVGCTEINEIVTVRGAPRYFTPNGDGFNDFWHVKEKENYPGLSITIMDRFGKRITSFTNASQGWDGTFNGQEMPSNAYWYRISYEGKEYYGHFSLIRRGGS